MRDRSPRRTAALGLASFVGLILVGATGIGIGLGLLVIRTGSLWPASAYHAGWNLMAAIVLGVRDSGVLHRGAFATTTLAGPAWLAGGGYGFEASLPTGLIEVLILGGPLRLAARWMFDPEAAGFFGRVPG